MVHCLISLKARALAEQPLPYLPSGCWLGEHMDSRPLSLAVPQATLASSLTSYHHNWSMFTETITTYPLRGTYEFIQRKTLHFCSSYWFFTEESIILQLSVSIKFNIGGGVEWSRLVDALSSFMAVKPKAQNAFSSFLFCRMTAATN